MDCHHPPGNVLPPVPVTPAFLTHELSHNSFKIDTLQQRIDTVEAKVSALENICELQAHTIDKMQATTKSASQQQVGMPAPVFPHVIHTAAGVKRAMVTARGSIAWTKVEVTPPPSLMSMSMSRPLSSSF